MREFLNRLFGRTRPTTTVCESTDESCPTRDDAEVEREKQEIQARLHDATNRMHVLEWQAEVESRRLRGRES